VTRYPQPVHLNISSRASGVKGSGEGAAEGAAARAARRRRRTRCLSPAKSKRDRSSASSSLEEASGIRAAVRRFLLPAFAARLLTVGTMGASPGPDWSASDSSESYKPERTQARAWARASSPSWLNRQEGRPASSAVKTESVHVSDNALRQEAALQGRQST